MRKGPTSHSFISQRLQLHYTDWGNHEAPPLLLIHGGRDHCRNWDWVAEELSKDWHIIAPDLRGHGDSAWSPDGDYSMTAYLYDLAQLIHQKKLAPVTIIAHSMGGHITLSYASVYPETVRKLVIIEGLGQTPEWYAERESKALEQRIREWVDMKRAAAGRFPRRYPTLEEAYQRMKEENSYLSDTQARHLTQHGISQNEDGTYSWKFDNYVRFFNPVDIPQHELYRLWGNITCPVRILWGADSWLPSPDQDGRLDYFQDASLTVYENAGHWLHHDQLDRFLAEMKAFL
ncbi:MAG: alpha/beta hydrolase [Porticoccaceae bacterium]|nr:alpha/beta hydrolase [Porticoccaceae bacterium]